MAYHLNDTVSTLLGHAYGQKGTVALPIPPSTGAELGTFPAGINDTLEYLVNEYLSWRSTGRVHWCFLIGGPGNGKSEALRALAGALGVALPTRSSGDPAPRTIPTEWPAKSLPVHDGLEISFINDASIPRSESLEPGSPTSLFQDLVDGLERLKTQTPVTLFANVNRGVLIEELAACDSGKNPVTSELEKIVSLILTWLTKPDAEYPTANGFSISVRAAPETRFYSQALLDTSEERKFELVVHALFLDSLSLLEPAPGAPKSIDFSRVPPLPAPYRPIGGVQPDQGSRESTIAGERMRHWAKEELWQNGGCRQHNQLCQAYSRCPFAQNASWMRVAELRAQVLSLFRALEIVGGRRLTYRDLLAHICLAITGVAEEQWLKGLHPCRWVEELNRRNAPSDITELAQHRIYANLFPRPSAASWKRLGASPREGQTVYASVRQRFIEGEESEASPLQSALGQLDPALDAEPWNGLRATIIDICEAADVDPPAHQLRAISGLPFEIHSDLEDVLDQVCNAEIADELTRSGRQASNRIKLLRRWRSILLLRQAGLATGNFTFKATVNAWLREHRIALNRLPGSQLQVGLGNLILPAVTISAGQSHILVLPFRPRTYALTTVPATDVAIVAIPVGDLRIQMVADGDRLVAEIGMVGATEVKKIADVVVDFSIAREGLIRSSGDLSGFTEIGYASFARIERARAALVGKRRAEALPLYISSSGGKRFRVEPNPQGGTPPLRIVPSGG